MLQSLIRLQKYLLQWDKKDNSKSFSFIKAVEKNLVFLFDQALKKDQTDHSMMKENT